MREDVGQQLMSHEGKAAIAIGAIVVLAALYFVGVYALGVSTLVLSITYTVLVYLIIFGYQKAIRRPLLEGKVPLLLIAMFMAITISLNVLA